jgi:hypothetical protein
MILSSYLPIFLIVDHPTLLMFVQKLSSRSSILNAEDHLVFGPVWQSIVEYLINFQKLNFTLIFLYLTKVEILISKSIEVQD